jgi:hypothetical protein
MIRRMLPVLVLACLLAPTCNSVTASAQASVTIPTQAATLKVSPSGDVVGGQGLQWTGNIGLSGVRPITMEKYLGRDGDEWAPVPFFTSETDAAGNFSYSYPAPAMQSVQYRVVSGTQRTPHVVLNAVQPDVVLWVTGDDRDDPRDIGKAVAGEPFGISIDTTPDLFRRPDMERLKPIPGRKLTLQRQVAGTGDKWVTLDSTTVGADGMGYITGVSQSQAGEVVYRVRQENWFRGDDKIGWSPSFPTFVKVSAKGVEPEPAMAAPPTPTSSDETEVPVPEGVGGPTTASQRYDWPQAYFDYAWEFGESLDSPPYRGTRLKGSWLDYSDGGGRVSKDGGGLLFDSKRYNDVGPGDFGTTKATLQNNPITYGRWESILYSTAAEGNAEDYRVRLELVPVAAPDDRCRTITVGEITAHGTTINFGVNADDTQWTGSYAVGPLDRKNFALALEVTSGHITWFVNGAAVGTVTDKAAISGVPMTMRLSMVGDGDKEMNRTYAKSDWQRGYSLDKGEQVTNGKALTKKSLSCYRLRPRIPWNPGPDW